MKKKFVRFMLFGMATIYVCSDIYEQKVFAHDTLEHQHVVDDNDDDEIVKLDEEQINKLGLQFKSASAGTLYITLAARGKIILHPDRLVHIIPKVSGVAKAALKNIGNFVRLNEVVAILESRDIADVKATFLAALSEQKLAGSILRREKRLYKEKVSAAQDFLNAENVYEKTVINAALAKQKLRTFGLDDAEIESLVNQDEPDLSLYKIRSPIDGTVIMRHITKGEFVENSTTIYEITDLSTVWVEIGIYPKDLYLVKEGQMVEIMNPTENKGSSAQLIYVSPIVSEETITARAVAQLENQRGLWRPGVFVKVNIAVDKIAVPLIVSKDAVQSSDGKDFVFIEAEKGFEKRYVELGRSDNENVEILTGLNLGEKYLLNNTFLLKAELGKNSIQDD